MPRKAKTLMTGGDDSPPSTKSRGTLHQGKAHQKAAQKNYAGGNAKHGKVFGELAGDAKQRRLKQRSQTHKTIARRRASRS
jgi:hypothetical protein